MKKIILFSFASFALALTFSSCKHKSTSTVTNNTEKGTTLVPIEYTKIKTLTDSIPSFTISLPVPLTDTFATKVDEMLATYAPGVTKTDIIYIQPRTMRVTIDNTTAQTLDFVDDSVKVYVGAYGGTDSVLVATKYGILPGAKVIDFNVDQTKDIKDLFYNPYMKFTLKFNTKPYQGMLANTTFVTAIKFEIKAYTP